MARTPSRHCSLPDDHDDGVAVSSRRCRRGDRVGASIPPSPDRALTRRDGPDAVRMAQNRPRKYPRHAEVKATRVDGVMIDTGHLLGLSRSRT